MEGTKRPRSHGGNKGKLQNEARILEDQRTSRAHHTLPHPAAWDRKPGLHHDHRTDRSFRTFSTCVFEVCPCTGCGRRRTMMFCQKYGLNRPVLMICEGRESEDKDAGILRLFTPRPSPGISGQWIGTSSIGTRQVQRVAAIAIGVDFSAGNRVFALRHGVCRERVRVTQLLISVVRLSSKPSWR